MAERRNSEDHPDGPGNEDRPEETGSEDRPEETGSEDRPEETGSEEHTDSDEGGNGDGSDSDRITGTSPSGADISKVEKFEPSEEAKQTEPSTEDAMGQDKRRQVVGQTYGPSKRRQFMFFAIVAGVLVLIIGGWLALVAAFDKPPTHITNTAPWSKTQTDPQLAAQQKTPPLSPLSPCGEPGNQYPIPAASPCAPPSEANGHQGAPAGNIPSSSKAQ